VSEFQISWILIFVAALVTEVMGIAFNDKSDAAGKPREFRTLTENLRMMFATDKAGARARYRGVRRVSLLGGLAWIAVHLLVENWV
jgi:hypothetical protein